MSAEATLYGGPLAGAAVLGAGNDITRQVAQNGLKNINLWQTADATAMSMATSYLGGQLSQKFAPQFSKLTSKITASPVLQQGLTDGLTYASTGFVLTTGMTKLSGADWETSLKAGSESALTSFGMGFMNGSISGFKYAKSNNLKPWTGSPNGIDIVGTNHNAVSPTQDWINPDKVAEYKTKIRSGEDIPPIKAYRQNGKLYIEDGHHRYAAYLQLGLKPNLSISNFGGPIGFPDWSYTSFQSLPLNY